MLAISVDDLRGADYAVQSFQAGFPILYTSRDPAVPESFGVWNLHRDNLAAPSIFIIDKMGRLVWENIEAGPYHRIPTDQVIEALENAVGVKG